MDESHSSRMTLRRAIAGQWQVPLFIVSVVGFGVVLVLMRPKQAPPDFEAELASLSNLAGQNRYIEFYGTAELVRQLAENDEQLGRVHRLVGGTRAVELRQRNELGLDLGVRRGAAENYERILTDYSEALGRGQPTPDSSEAADVYRDMALAYWGLNDAERTIIAFKKAIEVAASFDPDLHRSLTMAYLASRPAGYLVEAMGSLELILAGSESSDDDRAWAFVRKAEVLIGQGREPEALAMLDQTPEDIRNSSYGNELEFLRGRALRRAGQVDRAELVLRDLVTRIEDRGDIYAQTLLELGTINYQQYRDHDARYFYELVVRSQMGKDWYVAGRLGMAECAAMQQRYDEAWDFYQETVDSLKRAPFNRAVSKQRVQGSLVALGQKLNLLKQYALSMRFMMIEQQISSADDRDAAHRFARMYTSRASELLDEVNEFRQGRPLDQFSQDDIRWMTQQNRLTTEYFAQAAQESLRVARLSEGDDRLYGQSLIRAAKSFNKAGDSERSIEIWLRFVNEREGDSQWPMALYNVAQAYQAVAQFDEAITYYELLSRTHPKSPSAFESAVPLARCYLGKEPPETDKAEQLLRLVLQHPAITPVASHFRNAMFELGELYYQNDNYPRAIKVLTTATEWYPDDPELGKYMFLVGNAYRRSGLVLDEALARMSATDTAGREKTYDDRRRYLKTARDYFQYAIEAFERMADGERTEVQSIYLRDSWIYWADCLFDLGRYREAVKRYELAALRYQLTPTALSAYVQIVNCQIKLGNLTEASSANERARLQLAQISDEDLASGSTRVTRAQWQEWFAWMANSGLW